MLEHDAIITAPDSGSGFSCSQEVLIVVVGIGCQRPFLIISIPVDAGSHVGKGGAQMYSQFVAEFLGAAGVAVVIGLAPLQVCFMDLARGDAAAADLTLRPMTHALLKEGNDRAVSRLILRPGSDDGFWFGEYIAVGNDGLQCLHTLLDNSFTLRIHLIQ